MLLLKLTALSRSAIVCNRSFWWRFVLSIGCWIFCWYRSFRQRTESDLVLFLYVDWGSAFWELAPLQQMMIISNKFLDFAASDYITLRITTAGIAEGLNTQYKDLSYESFVKSLSTRFMSFYVENENSNPTRMKRDSTVIYTGQMI